MIDCKEELEVKRGQFLFKEGESSDQVFIIIEGTFEQSKAFMVSKLQNHDHDLLLKNTVTVKRFPNFKSNNQVLKQSEVRIMQFGSHRMVGELDSFKKQKYETSIRCICDEAKVWKFKRD